MAKARFAMAVAAWMVVSASALAQTNDPNLSQQDIDCIQRQGEDCLDGSDTGNRQPVAMPDLIVDLFPGGALASDGSLPSNPPLPQPAPRTAEPPQTGLPPVAALQAISGAFVPDEVLVTVDGDASVATDLAAAFELDIRSQRESALLGATVVRFGIPDGRSVSLVLSQLAGDGRTGARVPNHIYDLQQGAANYAFKSIALDAGTASGEDVGIAVVDTAIDETHPVLKDAVAGLFDAMPDIAVTSRDHATSVAGLIAGSGVGVAPGARIHHARAFEGGKSNIDIILAALDWAAGQDVRIVNMSFVGPSNGLLEEACAAMRAKGLVLIAAAGNNGPKAPYGYPAAYDGVLAVTATDDRDELMQQANRGSYVFVSAPGVGMVAPIGGGMDLVTGTSFAAAIVSGAVANLLHADSDRSADWVEKALAASAKDLGKAGRDTDYGFGLVDIRAAAATK